MANLENPQEPIINRAQTTTEPPQTRPSRPEIVYCPPQYFEPPRVPMSLSSMYRIPNSNGVLMGG